MQSFWAVLTKATQLHYSIFYWLNQLPKKNINIYTLLSDYQAKLLIGIGQHPEKGSFHPRCGRKLSQSMTLFSIMPVNLSMFQSLPHSEELQIIYMCWVKSALLFSFGGSPSCLALASCAVASCSGMLWQYYSCSIYQLPRRDVLLQASCFSSQAFGMEQVTHFVVMGDPCPRHSEQGCRPALLYEFPPLCLLIPILARLREQSLTSVCPASLITHRPPVPSKWGSLPPS